MAFDPSTATLFDPESAKPVEENRFGGIMPTQSELENVGKSLTGVGETGVSMLTGLGGQVAGGLKGLYDLATGKGGEAATKSIKDIGEAMTFQPRTEEGKAATEKFSKGAEKVLKKGSALASQGLQNMPFIPEGAVPKEFADLVANIGFEAAMNFFPFHAIGKGVKPREVPGAADELLSKVEGKKSFDPGTAEPISLEQAIKEVEPQNAPMSELTPDVVSEVNPARDRAMQARQMELDLRPEPEVMPVTPGGEVLTRPGDVAAYEQFGRKPEAPVERPMGQQDMFMNEQVEGPVASPYNAAERGTLPEVLTENPALARRQMELQLGEQEPIHVTQAGEATRGLPERPSLIQETDAIIEQAKAAAEAKQRELIAKQAVEKGDTGNLFPDYVNQHRPYELFRDENGQPLTRRAFEETINNLVKEPRSVYERPADMDAAYTKYRENFEGVQAGLFDQPTTAKEMAAVMKKEATERMADRHPLVLAAEKFLNKEQQFLDQLKQQGASAAAIRDAARDVELAQQRLDKTRENVKQGLSTGKRVSALRKKQGGGIDPELLTLGLNKLIDSWRKKKAETSKGEAQRDVIKNIPGASDAIRDYLPEKRPMEEIIAEAKQRPDVEQNWLQRVSNQFTAGGLYQSLKTNNILVKKTFETVSEAYDKANQNIRSFIQDGRDGLAPAVRNLNDKELGQIWAKMMVHEGERALTSGELRVAGFNEKQIKMYESARRADDAAFTAINDARALAGKKPIDRRLGHVAGVFSGDFKRSFYTTVDGEKVRVAVIGDNTRWGLNRMAKKIQEKHPEWELGEEHFRAGSGRSVSERQKAFEQALEFLSENDPGVKELVQTYQETMTKDAYNYLNQKKHTLQKRGVLGSEGNKEVQTIEKNAVEGMKAQIKYVENVFRWAELSKAANELKPLLSDKDVNMPNAKAWANNYLDRALGINNSKIGKALDDLVAGVSETTGVGSTAVHNVLGATKNLSSKVLLGFGNLGFLATNLIQPIVGIPAMRALLGSRGLDVSISASALKANMMLLDKWQGKAQTGFNKQLFDYAETHGLFQSEIFDHTSQIRKNVPYYVNKVAEFGIGKIEEATRATTFMTLSHMLKDAGIKPEEGLLEAAHKMTNQVMTDYRAIEMPKVYQDLGPVGHLAANLARFKHNQLSSIAMYAREIKNNKSYAPLGVALATQLAAGGILGMIGFQEADGLYQMITRALGKPDTLARLVLDHSDNTLLTHGAVSAATGIDFSNRLGMQDVIPNSVTEAMFPGGSRLADMATATGAAVMNPSTLNTERAVREVVPNSLRGVADRAFFEDQGLAKNPRTLEGTVQRTNRDKLAKSLGMTGIHESKEKARLYQESLVDKAYTDKRKSITSKMLDDIYTIRKDPEAIVQYMTEGKGKELRDKFLENEGNVDNLVQAIVNLQTNTNITQMQKKMLSVAAAQKEGDVKKLQRYQHIREKME